MVRCASLTATEPTLALADQDTGRSTERSLRFAATARRPIAMLARLPWAELATIGVFLGMMAWAVWFTAEDNGNAFLSRLWEFAADAYQGWDIQILLAMAAIGLALERIIPGRRQDMTNLPINLGYSAMVLLFVGAIVPLQVMAADIVVSGLGWRNIFDLRFDASQSIWLALGAMLLNALIIDFFFYWFHRCQHTVSVLWQIHLLHHSDMALNVTTTHRVHFLEHLLTPFFLIVPVLILFDLPDKEMFWIATVPALWSYFVHANARIGFGRFWWLLSSPQYHRVHHSILPEHHDRNFAVWFPFYDVLFGTAYVPKRDEYPPSGVEGVAVSKLPHAFVLPFTQWWGMAKDRLTQTTRTGQ
jgi:sterol desaturase/sphingolipid hydroxylase (fatty acid hydroxylase superfamily)